MKDPRDPLLQQETLDHIGVAIRALDRFAKQCEESQYTSVDELWVHANGMRALLGDILVEAGPKKKYSAHVRLAEEIYAVDEDDAYDQMMELLDDRGGMEIMGHDIIEENTGEFVRYSNDEASR